MKTFDKAEPMYLEAIKILEESYGTEDIRFLNPENLFFFCRKPFIFSLHDLELSFLLALLLTWIVCA